MNEQQFQEELKNLEKIYKEWECNVESWEQEQTEVKLSDIENAIDCIEKIQDYIDSLFQKSPLMSAELDRILKKFNDLLARLVALKEKLDFEQSLDIELNAQAKSEQKKGFKP